VSFQKGKNFRVRLIKNFRRSEFGALDTRIPLYLSRAGSEPVESQTILIPGR